MKLERDTDCSDRVWTDVTHAPRVRCRRCNMSYRFMVPPKGAFKTRCVDCKRAFSTSSRLCSPQRVICMVHPDDISHWTDEIRLQSYHQESLKIEAALREVPVG